MSLRGIQENGDGESTAHMEKKINRQNKKFVFLVVKTANGAPIFFFSSPEEGQRNSSGELIPDLKKKMCEYSCWKILFQHNFRIYILFCWLTNRPPPLHHSGKDTGRNSSEHPSLEECHPLTPLYSYTMRLLDRHFVMMNYKRLEIQFIL